jgi:hypothetical protein
MKYILLLFFMILFLFANAQKLKQLEFATDENMIGLSDDVDHRQAYIRLDSVIQINQPNDTTWSFTVGGITAYLQIEIDRDYNEILTGGSQQISLSGNIITLTNGSQVDLGPLLANISDDQLLTDLSLSGNILSVTIEGGNTKTIDLSSIVTSNTDDQIISSFSISGANILTISIEDGNSLTVDLSAYLDNTDTDDQNSTEVSLSTSNFGGNITTNANTVQKFADEVDNAVFTGPQGDQGDKGDMGDVGVGITSIDENNDGTFTVNLSDNSTFTTIDLSGDTGLKGDQGVSLSSVTSQGGGVLRFNFSNSTFYDSPSLTGAQGSAGVGISTVTDQGGGVLRITFTDASFQDTPSFTGAQGSAGTNGANGTNGADGDDGLSLTPQDSVEYFADLPSTGNSIGDTRVVSNLNEIYGWSGTVWFYMGIAGSTGAAGTDGVGFVSTVNNGDGTYTFNYSDFTSFTTSDLTGPTGAQGSAASNTDNQLLGDIVVSTTNRTIVLEDGGSKTFSVADNDNSSTNELELPAQTNTNNNRVLASGGSSNSQYWKVDDDTQLSEAEVDAMADNNGYLESEVDGSITNETITGFAIDGTNVKITEAGTEWTLPLSSLQDGYAPNTDQQAISFQYNTSFPTKYYDLQISGNNRATIEVPESNNPLSASITAAGGRLVLSVDDDLSNYDNATSGFITSANDADSDPANEIQNLASVLGEGGDAGAGSISNLANLGAQSIVSFASIITPQLQISNGNGSTIITQTLQIAGSTSAPTVGGTCPTVGKFLNGSNGNLYFCTVGATWEKLNGYITDVTSLGNVTVTTIGDVRRVEFAAIPTFTAVTFAEQTTAPSCVNGVTYYNDNDDHFYGCSNGSWKQLDND